MRRPASSTDRRPLAGRTIVVCRAEADAGEALAELRSLGATAVPVPLHRFVALADDDSPLAAAMARLDHYDWLVVTSANGVRALAAHLDTARLDTARLDTAHSDTAHLGTAQLTDTPAPTDAVAVAAVGPATAAAFAERGVEVSLVPERATAADLVAAFPPPSGEQRVLAPLNEAADDTLVEGLEAKGYLVDRIDAYRMVLVDDPPPAELAAADAVLFSASSQVDAFVNRFGLASVPTVVACIGPRTTTAARDVGLEPIAPPTSHSMSALIAAVVGSLRTKVGPLPDEHLAHSAEKRTL